MTSTLARSTAALGVAAALALTGCTGGPQWRDGGAGPGRSAAPVATVTSPADGATDVVTAAEIVHSGGSATDVKVTLTDAAGKAVEGAPRPDGSTWLPAAQLAYATKYTASVTATAGGRTTTSKTTFTTMPKPANLARVSSVIGDDQVVGVGAPIVVNLGVEVARDQRAAVQKRLLVTSDPPQEGIWNWFNAKEVHYRPREYWKPGTKLTVRLATGGLPIGGGWYGAQDIGVTATVGPKIVMTVDNATKTMTVTKDDQVLRTIPVSLGKPSTPSSSGNMVVMVKNEWEWFDSSTYGVPADSTEGYRTKVYWPQRLTWSGEYIHAAPWSEAQQGNTNVSHGCTNVSSANAQWLYSITQIGDPVIVKGTEQPLKWGVGWTDWNVSWEEYVKGSAIAYQPAGSATPSPSAS